MRTQEVTLNTRIDRETKELLKQLAERDSRSQSGMLRVLIRRAAAERSAA
jgi:predicted DNA-binding protein